MIDLRALYRRAQYAKAHGQPVYLRPDEWPQIWAEAEAKASRTGLPPIGPAPTTPAPGSTLFGQPVEIADLAARDQATSAQLWSPNLDRYLHSLRTPESPLGRWSPHVIDR